MKFSFDGWKHLKQKVIFSQKSILALNSFAEPRWFRLLDEFITPLSGKRGYCSRIVEKYARVLLHQGFELSQTDGPLRVAAIAASRDVGQAGNLPSVLNNLSEVTRHLNLAQYASTSLATVGQRKFANEVVQ